MAECLICQIIEGHVPSKKLYEDDEVSAFLDLNGALLGHAFVVPKRHIPIFEHVPDTLVGKLFALSNRISTALFEGMNVQGTNIFVMNGVSAGQSVAHFMIQVLPRREKDGINLQWQPRQLTEEEMSTVELKLKDSAKHVGITEQKAKNEEVVEAPRASVSGEDNYLLNSFRRRPG